MRTQFAGGKDSSETAAELDVQVQIEQAIMVDYGPAFAREDYRKPRVMWDRRESTTRGDADVLSGDQNQWELSSVQSMIKTRDPV